ncbi:MAG: hypothetical protein V3T84_15405 [Phycisphaerales bacterium]
MKIIRVLLTFALALSATGCSGSSKPIRAWQASVETYIADHGNGDVNALRNIVERPSQKTIDLIDAKSGGIPVVAPSHTDVNGLLLGHRRINGRKWYLFLVGALHYDGRFENIPLDDPQLRDVRIVALCSDRGTLRWIVGRENKQALAHYRRKQQETWRRRHPGRDHADTVPSRFPTQEDNFKLSISAVGVTVVDEPSGAEWALAIPGR